MAWQDRSEDRLSEQQLRLWRVVSAARLQEKGSHKRNVSCYNNNNDNKHRINSNATTNNTANNTSVASTSNTATSTNNATTNTTAATNATIGDYRLLVPIMLLPIILLVATRQKFIHHHQ